MNLLDVSFDVNKLADQIQHAIGQYGPMVWEMAIRQAVITGLTETVIGSLFLIASTASVYFTVKLIKKGIKEDEEDYYLAATGTGLLAGVGYIPTFVLLNDGIQHLLNPGWFALMSLKP